MKLPGPLFVIAAIFLGFAVVFSINTPYRTPGVLLHSRAPDPVTGILGPAPVIDIGAPDELQHANYIAHLREGKGFPLFVPGSPDLGENYQSHQPPLYYLLGTAWSAITGADPADPDAGLRLRFLNILIGVGTLFGIYAAGYWGTGRESVGLAAAAFAGLMPMYIAIHAAVTNDPLLFLICTWVLAFSIRGLLHGWTTKITLSIGILIGLGILTKTTAVILLPLAGFALLLSHRKPDPESHPRPAIWAIALALPLLIAAPWMIRNQTLYGDPLAMNAFNQAFVGSPAANAFIQADGMTKYLFNWVGWYTGRSFIGTFGYMDIFLFEQLPKEQANLIYVILLAVISLLVALGIYFGVSQVSRKIAQNQDLPDPLPAVGLAFLLIVLTKVVFLRFNLQYFQGQGRYLYPAIAGFALLAGMGVCGLGRHSSKFSWLYLAIPLIVLDFISLEAIRTGFPLRH